MKRKTHDWSKINYSIVQPVHHYIDNLYKYEINRGKYASEEVYRKRKKKRNCLRQLSLEANFSGVLFPSPRAKWLYEFKWHSYQSIIGIDSVESRHLKEKVPVYRMEMTPLTYLICSNQIQMAIGTNINSTWRWFISLWRTGRLSHFRVI